MIDMRLANSPESNGKRIYVFYSQCPICGHGKMEVREAEYELPRMGPTILVSRYCPACGFKRREIMPLTIKPRKRIYLRVEGQRDFRVKIIRAGTASIEIPELGVVIDPGIDAPMYLTNIEGLLERIRDAITSMCVLLEPSEMEGIQAIVEALDKAGNSVFTVIIDDVAGISQVLKTRSVLILEEMVSGELI